MATHHGSGTHSDAVFAKIAEEFNALADTFGGATRENLANRRAAGKVKLLEIGEKIRWGVYEGMKEAGP